VVKVRRIKDLFEIIYSATITPIAHQHKNIEKNIHIAVIGIKLITRGLKPIALNLHWLEIFKGSLLERSYN
jgi:hypothetical protein